MNSKVVSILFDFSIGRYKEALEIFDRLGLPSSKSILLVNIPEILYKKGEYSDALKNLKTALKIDRQLGNLLNQASDLNTMGKIFYEQGKFEKALKQQEKTFEISK
ncbi:MAG: tetratricopeptide repeat protein [Candidatus Lokiarchaeota archaeon]|nr:tetratricopeptide repeat protein [Candidatus Lokiarchaeota archaeon]